MKHTSRWLRLYCEVYRDPKVSRLSDKHFRFWVGCLCLAAENNGLLPADSDIAYHLRLKESEVATRKTTLLAAGLLDDTAVGFAPHNWDGRQFDSDTSAERTRRYRENKKRHSDGDCDNVVTSPTRHSDALETDTEKRREETETKCDVVTFHNPASFDGWWDLWSSVRGTNHRLQALHAFGSVVTAELECECSDCTRSYLESLTDPAKGYNPETFLFEQVKDRFKARWPRAQTHKKKSFVDDVTETISTRLNNGQQPW